MTKERGFDLQDCLADSNRYLRDIAAISMLVASLFVASGWANDDSLATSSMVDYKRLKSDFANPPQESKLRCFWFWQYGVATKKSITQDLEAMKAAGYGGALVGDNGGREGQVGPVFMSDEWKANFAHAVREAERLGLELSLNIQSGWGDPGNPNIQPHNAMKRIVSSEIHVTGPKKLQQTLPKPKSKIYYEDIAIQAFKRVDAGEAKSKSTLHNWDIKSFNRQSGLQAHRQNRPNRPDDVVIDTYSVLDLSADFSNEILTWEVPAGDWTIVRYGMSATGKRNDYAAPGYRGGALLRSDSCQRHQGALAGCGPAPDRYCQAERQ